MRFAVSHQITHPFLRSLSAALLLCALLAYDAAAQGDGASTPPPIDSATAAEFGALRVESRRGYLIRLPSSARLDSARSGWSPKERFERRIYVLDGIGEFILTLHVRPDSIPEGARTEGAYQVIDVDRPSSAGTRYERTWYLQQRRLHLAIVPYGIAMRPILAQRYRIFRSFRWKSGADSDREIIDEGMPVPELETARGLGS